MGYLPAICRSAAQLLVGLGAPSPAGGLLARELPRLPAFGVFALLDGPGLIQLWVEGLGNILPE